MLGVGLMGGGVKREEGVCVVVVVWGEVGEGYVVWGVVVEEVGVVEEGFVGVVD